MKDWLRKIRYNALASAVAILTSCAPTAHGPVNNNNGLESLENTLRVLRQQEQDFRKAKEAAADEVTRFENALYAYLKPKIAEGTIKQLRAGNLNRFPIMDSQTESSHHCVPNRAVQDDPWPTFCADLTGEDPELRRQAEQWPAFFAGTNTLKDGRICEGGAMTVREQYVGSATLRSICYEAFYTYSSVYATSQQDIDESLALEILSVEEKISGLR